MHEETTHIYGCGLRPLRQADDASSEITWPLHWAIPLYIDRRMPRNARWKHGNGDEGIIPLRDHRGIFCERHFSDIKIPKNNKAMKHLLYSHYEGREVYAFDRDTAACEVGKMVVVGRCKRQL